MTVAGVTAPLATSQPSPPRRGRAYWAGLLEWYLVWRREKRPIVRHGKRIAAEAWDFLSSRTLAAMHSFVGRVESGAVSVRDTHSFVLEIERIREEKAPVKVSVACQSLGDYNPPAPADPETVEPGDDRAQLIKDAIARVRRRFKESNNMLHLTIFNEVRKKTAGVRTHHEVATAAGCSVFSVNHALRTAEQILRETLDHREAALVIKINRKRGRPSRGQT